MKINNVTVKNVLWFPPGLQSQYDRDFFKDVELEMKISTIVLDKEKQREILEIFDEYLHELYLHRYLGIALIETEHGDKKAYIGIVKGDNEKADIQHIVKWGGPIFPTSATILYEFLVPQKNKEDS